MKILLLENEIPYPVNTGRRIRTWSFITALAKEHELSLLCVGSAQDSDYTKELKAYFKNIWVVKPQTPLGSASGNRWKNFSNLIKGIPWDIYSSFSSDLEDKFLELFKEREFDLLFCRYIYAAQYFFRNRHKIKLKMLVDLDDIETLKWKRKVEAGNIVFKGFYDRFRNFVNQKMFERYHGNLRLMDGALVCSERDKEYVWGKGWTKNVFVVPNSIDIALYRDVKNYDMSAWTNKIILFCGNLMYAPNVEGLKWFVDTVWPLILAKNDGVRLHIVGFRPRKEVLALADNKSIFVFADVPSVLPYYHESSLVIAPLWIAGGTRIKILEAFACRRPVIATTIGAEGLGTNSGKECLISDDSAVYASQCLELLSSFDTAKTLSETGYDFVNQHYHVEAIRSQIRELFAHV